jgi:hypothetical protein
LSSDQLFDTIGASYAATRPDDPRIAARIWAALGDARTVVNVGAGTGAYEPPGREVTAVEPSAVMRAQRPAGAVPCVPGVAGRLPFADQSFDAAMAVLTDQHWPDVIAGYREMRRVARRVVTFHFDIARLEADFWLIHDYMPEHAQLTAGRPALDERARRAVSVWHLVGRAVEERVVRDLRADLESGRWAERNSGLPGLDEIDLGGRLLIA